MRFTRLAMLTLGAALTAACSEPSNDPTTPDIPPLAYVRYINAVPDTLNTTVRFIDQVEWSPMSWASVPFRGLGQGNYQPTEAGSRKFRVFTAFTDATVGYDPARNTVILVDTTLTFEAGKYYTLLHTGYARTGSTPRQRIVLLNDVHPTPGAQISVRAINLALGSGAVDVYTTATATTPISGTPLFRNVAIDAVSTYSSLSVGAFATQFATAGATTALAGAAAPAGTAGTTALNPIAGATIAGSVLSAVAFPASATNSPGARFTTPGVVYFIDKNPPSTAP